MSTEFSKEDFSKHRNELFDILKEHWCNQFPYDEYCKSCNLEIEICEKLAEICGVDSSVETVKEREVKT